MPVKLSRFYNDPSIGRGFESIAQSFAPPEATDQLAITRAMAEREKASRLAEYYTLSKNPGVTRDQLERQGIGAGMFNPNQGYYAVDQGNATTLRTNAADNARQLQQERLRQEGDTTRSIIAPLNEGQTRAPGLGQYFGLKGLPENTQGGVTLSQGQTYTGPNGFTAQGAPKPLSETEVKAQVLAGLPASEQRAVALQGVPTDNVVTPNGPRIAFRPDAVGQQPAATPVEPQNATNYRTPDGREGTAALRNGNLVDTQTGAPIDAGSVQFSTAVQGAKDQTGLGTSNVNKLGQRLLDMDLAEQAIDQHAELIRKTPGALGGIGAAARTFQDIVASGGEAAAMLKKYDVDTQKLIAQGRISPEVMQRFGNFDPSLPAIDASRQRLIALLAAAQSSDGNVSNRDVQRIEAQVGGTGIFSNDQETLARLASTKDGLRSARARIQQANPEAARNFPGSAAPVPTASGAPATTAPAAPAAPAGGNVRTVQTPEEAMALPSGTPFRTPDGRLKVRP